MKPVAKAWLDLHLCRSQHRSGACVRRAGELLFTLARAFPRGRYHGYDISQQSVDAANKRCVAGCGGGLLIRSHLRTFDAECSLGVSIVQYKADLQVLHILKKRNSCFRPTYPVYC